MGCRHRLPSIPPARGLSARVGWQRWRRRASARLQPSGRGGGHLVAVPPNVIEALGGKGRIPVTATINGVPHRGSIIRMGEGAVLGVKKAIIAEAGISVGHALRIEVGNDDAPREVDVPHELAQALRRNRRARAVFDGLSYSHRGSTRKTSPRRSGPRLAPGAPSARSRTCFRRRPRTSADPQSEGRIAPGASQPALCISASASKYASSSDGGGLGSIPFT